MPTIDTLYLKSLIANLEKDLQLLKNAVNKVEQQQQQQQQQKKKKNTTERAPPTSAYRNAQRWYQEHYVES